MIFLFCRGCYLSCIILKLESLNYLSSCGTGWKLLSCGHCQELSQRPYLDPDWMHLSWQPIRIHISLLTQLLTMTTTHKFPPLNTCADRTIFNYADQALPHSLPGFCTQESPYNGEISGKNFIHRLTLLFFYTQCWKFVLESEL